MKGNRDYSIRAVGRVAEVLNCFTLKEPELSLMDISGKTGLHKSTAFRILNTLEQLKWVRRDSITGFYRLGFGLFELGFRSVQGLNIYKTSQAFLEALAKQTQQTVHLVVHDNGKALYINKLESPGCIISQPSQIGMRLPMYCTAVGKVLLSDMPFEDVVALLEKGGMFKITPNTINSIDDLNDALIEIREQGYAIDNEEIQIGLHCVAAPVRDYSGTVVAAISVSGLSSNFPEELHIFVDAVKQTAEQISENLGWEKRNL